MRNIFLNIADYYIKIIISFPGLYSNSIKDRIFQMYGKFIISEYIKKPDFTIEIFNISCHYAFTNFIQKEKGWVNHYLKLFKEKDMKIRLLYHASGPQISFIILYALQKLLSKSYGFILHASGILINNRIILFTGKSGIGKTTAVSLLKNIYAPFSDDMVIVRRKKKNYIAFQSPFGKENSIPLLPGHHIDKVFFLKKGNTMKIGKIKNKQKLLSLLAYQLYTDGTSSKKQLLYLFDFARNFNGFNYLSFYKNSRDLINIIKST